MDLVGNDFLLNLEGNELCFKHKTQEQKQKLLNAYFNSKSGCCPILRNLHDSTQYLILIEMMDAWESLR